MHDNSQHEKNNAALSSLLAAFVLTGLKLAVGLHTNSLGILSEALHSGLDLLAAAMTLVAVRISSRPADADHPYGHGKIENLSALAETLLLFLTCIWVVYEAVHRLSAGASPVTPSLWGVAVMGISILIDVNRVRVLRRVARKYKSQALEADALHFSTDILSSAVVLLGVLAVWFAAYLQLPGPLYTVLVQADTVAALLVAVIIFRASLRMAASAVNTLMDSGSDKDRRAVAEAVMAVPGITDVRRVRLRSSGPSSFVDLTVGVEPGMRVSEGHKLAHAAEMAVNALLPGADVTVHVEPLKARPEQNDNPFVLVQRTASEHGLPVHNVHMLRAGSQTYLELHVELPGSLPFAQGYAQVRAFEKSLGALLPGANIVTHLEPEGRGSACVPAHSDDPLFALAWEQVQKLVAQERQLGAPHKFTTYAVPEQGVCVSFHCTVDGALSVDEAHILCSGLETKLRALLPMLGRIIIHLEPASSSISNPD